MIVSKSLLKGDQRHVLSFDEDTPVVEFRIEVRYLETSLFVIIQWFFCTLHQQDGYSPFKWGLLRALRQLRRQQCRDGTNILLFFFVRLLKSRSVPFFLLSLLFAYCVLTSQARWWLMGKQLG